MNAIKLVVTKQKLLFILLLIFFASVFAPSVLAHEAYVLPEKIFQEGLITKTVNPLQTLQIFFTAEYLPATILVGVIFGVAYSVNFLLAGSGFGRATDNFIKRFRDWGLLTVRVALAASFLYGASSGNVFGPELQLTHVFLGQFISPLKFLLGIMFLLGLGTELAAVLGIILFGLVFLSFGSYSLTYLNYLGELVALALFGSRFLSVDGLLFGNKPWLTAIHKYKFLEVPIVRIGLGLALIYTAWNVKFIHQSLPLAVINQYQLQNYFFGWGGQYISVGAGIVELMIGMFFLFGFAQRLTVLIFMIFITLSLLFFREAVWPHLLLYGISVLLFIDNADVLTADRYLVPFVKKMRKVVGL